MKFSILKNQDGLVLPAILALLILLSGLGVALASIAVSNSRAANLQQRSQSAMNAAEAGINYYLWHLSHNSTDYKDGGSTPASAPYGPYTHDFNDSNGKKIGTFTLTITPPANNSTVTTVKSVGVAIGATGSRTIQAQLGIPSFASYALLTGTEVWFGPGENSAGPVHSNVGVHFDGANNGPVTSARATYVPTASFGGDGNTHNGIWGNGGPSSQWQFPVPLVDFTKVTADLQALKTAAQANGVYLPVVNASFSANRGYQILLKNDKTFDISKVNNTDGEGNPTSTTFVRNQAQPANGLLYVEDNVWVSGTWNGRMTIASGRLPDLASTNTSITITGNTSYTIQDGSVALGLIAQDSVAVASNAPNNLTINGALLAQKGHIWFPNYSGSNVKNTLSFFGALASFDYWTWSWVNGFGTITDGYQTNNNVFDTNLTFSPPPSYPTTGSYTILNWRELLTNP